MMARGGVQFAVTPDPKTARAGRSRARQHRYLSPESFSPGLISLSRMPRRPEAFARPSALRAGAASTTFSSFTGRLGVAAAAWAAVFLPLAATEAPGAPGSAAATAAVGGATGAAAGALEGSGGTMVAFAGVMTLVTPGPAETAGWPGVAVSGVGAGCVTDTGPL